MIVETLKSQLVQAMKSREIERTAVLRFLLAQIKNKEIELRSQHVDLNDEHVVKVINKLIKRGKESAESYRAAGREDLATKEEGEITILEEIGQEFSKANE